MTRDQIIAHLEIHGYHPYLDGHGWAAVYSWDRGIGCICKKFGEAWDVRPIRILLHIGWEPVGWESLSDDELARLAGPAPAKRGWTPDYTYVSV